MGRTRLWSAWRLFLSSRPGGQWLPFRGCDAVPSLSHHLRTTSFLLIRRSWVQIPWKQVLSSYWHNTDNLSQQLTDSNTLTSRRVRRVRCRVVRTLGPFLPSTAAAAEDEEEHQHEEEPAGRGPDDDGQVGLLLLATRKTDLMWKKKNKFVISHRSSLVGKASWIKFTSWGLTLLTRVCFPVVALGGRKS